MKSLFSQFCTSLRKFHSNEDGMETLQVVMILGIAAVIAVALYAFGKQIWDMVKELIVGKDGKSGILNPW